MGARKEPHVAAAKSTFRTVLTVAIIAVWIAGAIVFWRVCHAYWPAATRWAYWASDPDGGLILVVIVVGLLCAGVAWAFTRLRRVLSGRRDIDPGEPED